MRLVNEGDIDHLNSGQYCLWLFDLHQPLWGQSIK